MRQVMIEDGPFTSLSVIIPVYNGQDRLLRLLGRLRSQDYDQATIEIVVVDDDSTDRSADVARRFGATVVRNGSHNIERGKAIGIRHSSHELLLFIDDDNGPPHRTWLKELVAAYRENPGAAGAQAARYCYNAGDPLANRYCSIFGAGDPVAFYLGRRDRLMLTERSWALAGTVVKDAPSYWLVEFTAENIPTYGSQGFLTRRSLVEKIPWWPYFFHMDSCLALVTLGYSSFVNLKDCVIHDAVDSTAHLLGKLRRNIRLFLRQKQQRSYRYDLSAAKIAVTGIRMVTGVEPLFFATIQAAQTRDLACFLHPYLCFRVPMIYIEEMIRYRLEAS